MYILMKRFVVYTIGNLFGSPLSNLQRNSDQCPLHMHPGLNSQSGGGDIREGHFEVTRSFWSYIWAGLLWKEWSGRSGEEHILKSFLVIVYVRWICRVGKEMREK